MSRTSTLITAAGLALAAGAVLPGAASAAPAAPAASVVRSAGCSTSAAEARVSFTVVRGGAHGVLRAAQATAEGEFVDTPAMTVRVRDGAGTVRLVRRSTDGSLGLAFARRIGGPGWTAQATIENTAAGACTTPRVRLAVG